MFHYQFVNVEKLLLQGKQILVIFHYSGMIIFESFVKEVNLMRLFWAEWACTLRMLCIQIQFLLVK